MILLLLSPPYILSQQDTSKPGPDSLKVKVNSTVDKWLKESQDNKTDSGRIDLRISEKDSLIQGNTFTSGRSKKKNYGRWKPDDLVFEYALGGGMGILGGLVGGMLGSFAHTAGDTSKSGNDFTVDVVVVMMSIGHVIGTPFGVHLAAKKNGAKGELMLGILGTLIGDGAGIYLMAKGKKWPGIGVITLVTPLVSTLLFNVIDGSP